MSVYWSSDGVEVKTLSNAFIEVDEQSLHAWLSQTPLKSRVGNLEFDVPISGSSFASLSMVPFGNGYALSRAVYVE